MANKPGMGKNHTDFEGNLVTAVPFTRTKLTSSDTSQSIGAGDVGNYTETSDDAAKSDMSTPFPMPKK